MTIEEIKAGVGQYGELVTKIVALKGTFDIAKILKQYNTADHEIFDATLRPDKIYNTENGTAQSLVARLAVPLQKQVVGRAATFLCGNPIKLTATPEDDSQKTLLAAVQKVWDECKLDYKSKGIAKLMMAETEAAELWYVEPLAEGETYWTGVLADSVKFKMRMRVLANSLGDALYPVFAPTGDLIAFGRGYSITLDGNKVEKHFDLYTEETIYTGIETGGAWVTTQFANTYRKIPVIYYKQNLPEWADVQTLIDRFEKLMSNHADTNDYSGSPMTIVSGKVIGFAKKGESGKVIEVEQGGDIKYLTWDQAPASIKLEMENLIKYIYACTDTPNISFDEMKGLGTFSGIALKMLFLAAHMKASDKEEIFGESVQRRINYLKAVIGLLDPAMSPDRVQLQIKPKFEYFLPKNEQEKVDILTNAVQGKIMSSDSAVRLNPLVDDADAELEKLKTEADGAGALNNAFN